MKSIPSKPLLSIRGLTKTFDQRTVLDGIDFDLWPGETVALLGSNGCGKSTLLHCCVRLVDADRGTLSFQGVDLATQGRRDLRKLRSKVGFVFQKHNLVPRLSALTNVIHGHLGRQADPRFWLQSLAPTAIRRRALECLSSVGLEHLASRRARELSGGESQRVAVARALMQQPVLLLADEPVASLDPKVGHEVMALFVDLVKTNQLTLLFVSHDLDHALQYADRIVAIRAGRIVFDKPTSKVKKHELQALYH